MTLIAGGFEIEKPYYGLDRGNVFRRLGTVTHRGIEASLSGSPAPGLTLVAGGVLLDAKLSGEEVAGGSIGRRPIGTPSRSLTGHDRLAPAAAPGAVVRHRHRACRTPLRRRCERRPRSRAHHRRPRRALPVRHRQAARGTARAGDEPVQHLWLGGRGQQRLRLHPVAASDRADRHRFLSLAPRRTDFRAFPAKLILRMNINIPNDRV